ncbi:MAG: quinolinate synthase NadA [Candidatus Omnitrophota bacterium]
MIHNSDDQLKQKITKLKKQRKAIILVHNYQPSEVQDIADYSGDSLELSRIASTTEAGVVVFCGVHFMAETAAILCPDKTVLLPDINAGCPMADMITAGALKTLKQEHPQAVVIAYVNTSAEVKAEVDVCCTSTNAVKIVEALKNKKEIIFVPDKYLGSYVAAQTKKTMICWSGYCPTHLMILPENIMQQKKNYPHAEVLIHPECAQPVIALADFVLSTGGMCKHVKVSSAAEFIIATEIGLLHRLRKDNPEKKFYPASDLAICPNMKLITLEKILWALEEMKYIIDVPADIRRRAKKAVDSMLKII